MWYCVYIDINGSYVYGILLSLISIINKIYLSNNNNNIYNNK